MSSTALDPQLLRFPKHELRRSQTESLSVSSFLTLVTSEIILRMFAVQFRDFNILDLKIKI